MDASPSPILVRSPLGGPRIVAGVSTRHGGVSRPPFDTANVSDAVGDDPAHVTENRRRICTAAGFALDALTMARQVHGDEVAVVDASNAGQGARAGDAPVAAADALVTATPGVLLAVLVADCVPVLLADPGRGVVAVAHAGWRGTVAHVVRRTVATMIARFGCSPGDLRAVIGPSIGPASYEVGPEVVAAAHAAFGEEAGVIVASGDRTCFDLWTANAHDLEASGVPRAAIEVSRIDTFTRTDTYFSHRAGAPTGRFLALVGLTPT